MNWTSWNDFFAMGGYALYVWGSYAATFALIAVEVVLVRRRRRVALRDARTLRVSEGGAP